MDPVKKVQKSITRLAVENETNLQAFFNTISDFLWVIDEKWNIVTVNNTVAKRLGYSSEELIGRSFLSVHPPERRKEASVVLGLMMDHKAEYCPVPLYTKDGRNIPVETRIRKDKWNGKPAIFGVSKDISELLLSEKDHTNELLKESNRKLEEAQRIGKMGDWSYDLIKGTFEWSGQMYPIFGYSPFEKNPMEIFRNQLHPEDADEFWQGFHDHLKSEGSIFPRTEFRIIRNDGLICYGLIWGEFVYDKLGRKVKAFGTLQDISEYKRTELELMEFNATKDKFLSIIAHDLKSPFNTILGYTELLISSIQKCDSTNLEKYGNRILAASEQALSFLVNLLEWSRSNTGRIAFKPEVVDVKKLIMNVCGLLRYQAEIKLIDIKLNVRDNLEVVADKNMLRTIIINLLSNAIKFSLKGSEICIFSDFTKDGFEFSIKDDGVGIKVEDMEKLFQIDSHFSTKGTDDEKGTGLGLLLCKDFAEIHHGKVYAESEYGKGSIFKFIMPAVILA
jgi:two-component system, sensor histidine kinase and response regulator